MGGVATPEHSEGHVELAPVVDLVLHHEAQPLADRDRGPGGRHALLLEVRIGESAEDLHRLRVAALEKAANRLEAVGELASVARVEGRAALRVLGVHVTLDGGEVTHDVAQRELAGLPRPLETVRRECSRRRVASGRGPSPSSRSSPAMLRTSMARDSCHQVRGPDREAAHALAGRRGDRVGDGGRHAGHRHLAHARTAPVAGDGVRLEPRASRRAAAPGSRRSSSARRGPPRS